MFPSILNLRVAESSQEGKVAIISIKDREYNIVNIVDDILAIYNALELHDPTLIFYRFYFIFKDTISTDTSTEMKVVAVKTDDLLQYKEHKIDFNALETQIEVSDIKLRQQTDA